MTIAISNNNSTFRLNSRLHVELQLLEKVTPHIVVGQKTIGEVKYTAILIERIPLSSRKFKVTNSNMLFLLPPDYPRIPPIGCYLNYPWQTAGQGDRHFTLQSHYGAPFLSESGWYWYCVGLGGGFSREKWLNAWRPAKYPEKGHNLVTLFLTARHAINSEE
ncbi:hypothetical protein [Merismopedia glauca]|uniref:Uncharacterized protein n=1 Tax=Merismopedia glauca CCAP 1448/3 TaxID=1296344 RepID=A0A2T1C1F3_9CYAN|nr:hypothetical protein [Merismopedia glauca]PSB02106.1 hypothetical protein C7B64_14870 [Merismopedia glauca CCAP 1448/3]